MRRLFASYRWRVVMTVVLLAAFAPNALFIEHWAAAGVEAASEEEQVDAHAQHRSGAVATAQAAQGASEPSHCHVGPESCAASSGLSSAIVISAVLALTLLGGGLFLLDVRADHLARFGLARRLTQPPKVNLRSV